MFGFRRELRSTLGQIVSQLVLLTNEVKRMTQAETDLQNADASLAAAIVANTAENNRNATVIQDGLSAIKQLLTNASGTPDADLVALTAAINGQVSALQASTASLKTNNDTLEAAAQAVLTPPAPAPAPADPTAPAAPAA